LFTTEEETGMTGARELQPGVLKGDILLNMDSEDEGELYVGCAGGEDGFFLHWPFDMEQTPAGWEGARLNITGLKGGHSGMDIILGRGKRQQSPCSLASPLDGKRIKYVWLQQRGAI